MPGSSQWLCPPPPVPGSGKHPTPTITTSRGSCKGSNIPLHRAALTPAPGGQLFGNCDQGNYKVKFIQRVRTPAWHWLPLRGGVCSLCKLGGVVGGLPCTHVTDVQRAPGDGRWRGII